MLMII
jgi:hypothetical protein